jgi:hypothetical protein
MMDFVSWDDEIPNMMGKKNMFQTTTNQKVILSFAATNKCTKAYYRPFAKIHSGYIRM